MGTACQRLTAANVPHNLFIADCGARVFLFPNCFAEKKARGLIPEGELRMGEAGVRCNRQGPAAPLAVAAAVLPSKHPRNAAHHPAHSFPPMLRCRRAGDAG